MNISLGRNISGIGILHSTAGMACPVTLSDSKGIFSLCTRGNTNMAHGILVSHSKHVIVLAHHCGRTRFTSLYGAVSGVLGGWGGTLCRGAISIICYLSI